MRTIYLGYAVVLLLAVLIYVLFHYAVGFYPLELFGNEVQLLYGVDLLSMLIFLGGFYVVWSLEGFSWVRKGLHSPQYAQVQHTQRILSRLRLAAFALSLLSNVSLYSVLPYARAPKYGVMIALLTGLLALVRTQRSHS